MPAKFEGSGTGQEFRAASLPWGESTSKRRRGLLVGGELSSFSFRKTTLPVGESPAFGPGDLSIF